jgi:hypothetical protein
MKTSESIESLAKSLSKAQGEISNAIKNSANPHFKSRYADLAAIWDVIREPMSRNGIAIIQTINCIENRVAVNTMLLHESGQYISDTLEIPIQKMDAQSIGSASTYGRRYSLQAFSGVAGEDDDGNAASGKGPAPEIPTINTRQQQEISSRLKAIGKDESSFASHMGVTSLAEIPAINFNNALAIIKRAEAKYAQAAESKNEEGSTHSRQ